MDREALLVGSSLLALIVCIALGMYLGIVYER